MLFGIVISFLLGIVIVVTIIWFPSIGEYHDNHKRLVQAVLFTIIYFAIYVYGLKRWRHQGVFWPIILVLFLLHVLGVFFYSTHVRPILVWQWPIVGLVEYYGAAFFLEWSTRRLRHFNHQDAKSEAGGLDGKP